jgi:hypothetical protein
MAVTFVFRKKGKRTESGLSASFTLISDAGKKMDPRVREDDGPQKGHWTSKAVAPPRR